MSERALLIVDDSKDRTTHSESPFSDQRRRLVREMSLLPSLQRHILLLRILLGRLIVVEHDHTRSRIKAQPLVKLRSIGSSSSSRSNSSRRRSILPGIVDSSRVEETTTAATRTESLSAAVCWLLDEIGSREGCWTSGHFSAESRDFSTKGESDGDFFLVPGGDVGVGSGGLSEEGFGGSEREPGGWQDSCEGWVSVSVEEEYKEEREREESAKDVGPASIGLARTDDDQC